MPKKKRNNNSNKNTRKFTTIAILGLVFILSFFMFYLKEEKGITGGVSVNVEEVITPAGSGNVMLNEFFKYSVNISCSGEDCGEINVTLAPRIIQEDFEMDEQLENIGPSFIGEAAKDQSGYRISNAGDVNNDGYDDFLINAKNNSEGGISTGQTYLILGKAKGWTSDFNLSNADASFIGEDNYDYSGSISNAGDVNNDGYDDFLIGAYYNSEGGNRAGQTYLILGRADGWERDIDLSNANASFIGEVINDESGWEVSGAGDVNNDGFDDFLISSYKNDEGGEEAGQTYLILGRADGWERNIDLSNANASFIGEAANDNSGWRVSGAGDVNNDGYDDFLIGAYENDEGGEEAGQTYLIFYKDGIGIVPTSDLGLSFYTNATSNPQTINLNDGEAETVSFWINTTGGVGRT